MGNNKGGRPILGAYKLKIECTVNSVTDSIIYNALAYSKKNGHNVNDIVKNALLNYIVDVEMGIKSEYRLLDRNMSTPFQIKTVDNHSEYENEISIDTVSNINDMISVDDF